ncbi:MAG: hypothetical protein KGZ58_01100 [Ignavibacteriales bacterium]|nr:hypothetical protein [Ignavibacteriales bacterium]
MTKEELLEILQDKEVKETIREILRVDEIPVRMTIDEARDFIRFRQQREKALSQTAS